MGWCGKAPLSLPFPSSHSGRVLQVPMTACQKVWCRQLSVQKHCILPRLADGHILHNSVPV